MANENENGCACTRTWCAFSLRLQARHVQGVSVYANGNPQANAKFSAGIWLKEK